MILSGEAYKLLYLIEPWAVKMSDDDLDYLTSEHGEVDVLMSAAFYVIKHTSVPVSDLDADDLEAAAKWLLRGQVDYRNTRGRNYD